MEEEEEDDDEPRSLGTVAAKLAIGAILERSPPTRAPRDPRKAALWGQGPWCEEPDQVEWTAFTFPCALLRNPAFGNWCGYVGVEPGHPWHGVDRYDVDAEVHGGLTFSGSWHHPLNTLTVNPHTWWLGFDCAHGHIDLIPAWSSMTSYRLLAKNGNEYRTAEYCVLQAIGLAWQAKMATNAVTEGGGGAESNA
jgi:hypothetical protein